MLDQPKPLILELIYQNYNHINDPELDSEYYKISTRNLYEHHPVDISYLDHLDELNDGSNYYSEYYKARLQELCDLSLKKASSNHAKKIM